MQNTNEDPESYLVPVLVAFSINILLAIFLYYQIKRVRRKLWSLKMSAGLKTIDYGSSNLNSSDRRLFEHNLKESTIENKDSMLDHYKIEGDKTNANTPTRE